MPLAPLPFRLKRLHHRSAMFGEYYPQMMPYLPPMTFASGNTDISLQPEIPQTEKPCNDCAKDYEDTTQYVRTEIEHSSPVYEEISTKTPNYEESTTQKTKVVTKKPKQSEESSEENESWNGRGYPGMNVFFPMTFGYPYSNVGGNNARSHGNDPHSSDGVPNSSNGYPGSVTAIANSFSGGKGGVATSHATAFGNAPPVNFYSNSKKRSHDK